MTTGQPTLIAIGPPEDLTSGNVLTKLRDALQATAESDEWSPMLMFKVNMVLEELATNTFSHGNQDENGPPPQTRIRITSQGDAVHIEYSDQGRPFNPLTDGPPPLGDNPNPEDYTNGGLGLHLVRSIAQRLTYSDNDGRNNLTISIPRE